MSTKSERLVIVGLGYVGLPLGIGYIARGQRVLGLDIDVAKVDAINGGRSYIEHIAAEPIQQGVAAGLLSATTDFSRAADCDALIALQPAVVILGTGPTQVFPPRDVLAAFLTRRVGVEFMDNAAAARTYNVLLGEGRKVAAAFVLA